MHWPFIHYPPGDAPSREAVVRTPTPDAARAKLSRELHVPAATLRPLPTPTSPRSDVPAAWTLTHYPPGDLPSRHYTVRATTRDAAKAALALVLDVPACTIR